MLWIELPQQVDALALHQVAINQRIAFMPGPLFSASEKFGNYMRINCRNAWSAEIEKAMRTLGAMVHEHAEAGTGVPLFR